MPKLIRWRDGRASAAEDAFTWVDDDQVMAPGDVIVTLTRFQNEGEALLRQCRQVGVRLAAHEAPEALAADLPRLAVIGLTFPKFRDGRAYSAARILRGRLEFDGEMRAVGDVLLEQARFMVRCGFDAFEPADDSDADRWAAAVGRFRHVYQRAQDDREPAFVSRGLATLPLVDRKAA